MFSFFMVVLITFLLILLLYMVCFLMSLKENNLNKVNSFESGFLSLVKIQNSFSIHFFVLMLMFVIFDLEIVMFLGLLVVDVSSVVSFFMLFLFVLGGFYMEWFFGKLIWVV
uniref:NADH-ubiquinone oxidoreductase chain 3 n=1 Tax=Angiostrongylus cantonensis TaxID=6313 RepID=A0A1E1GIA5_ANGCA|nr:NADH dehydrogenase subunit 3 [Angiostrongylus cantonensis]QCS25201.1 NADH dehydrogenase subunit 3 [Angiostrongylus cantonensis]QCS25213.1 NADH dehydrogenase subunit 3 [Angiostrongylus cantonensis]QCS25225.1 NADH dehydrogenase subunit 3 [Angiostrongylus cantonensis]WKT13320.1 NADH dehydrogenase subunit 3 [Angiostrongylus cantonensis]